MLEHCNEGGTISKDQWEVAHLYKTFVFEKLPDPKFDKGPVWREEKEPRHIHVAEKDLVVLTDDCAPGAMQGFP